MNYKKFTLVELLVAMAIIGVLAGLVVGASDYIREMTREAATTATMAKIEAALERYNAEYGDYYVSTRVSEGGDVKSYDEPMEFNPNPNPATIKFNTKDSLKADAGMIKFCTRSENAKSFKDSSYAPITFLGEDYTWYDGESKETGLRDGWGNLFMYQYPGKNNQTKYD
ncbi:MAG: type II secretion system protein, partial [Lentisphaeria bacterium]